MLKNKVELLQTNDENLFGKEFSDHLTESVKSKKSSKEVFLKLDDSKKPFPFDPSFQQQQCKSGGQEQIATDNGGNRAKQNWSWSRKDTNFQGGGRRFQGKSITNSTVSLHISRNSNCRAGKRSSINKTLVFKRHVNKSIEHSSSWKDKSLLSKLAKVDSKPGYSVSGKGLQNTIHQDSFSTKNSKFYKDEQEANCSCGFGIKGDVEERGNNENSTCSRGVFEHLIPYGEKRRRLSPCDKSKNVEPVHSFSPFQNGRPFSVKVHHTGGRLDVQTGPEGCIFQCPIRSKLEEVRKISVEGDSYEFMCLCFGLGPAPSVFTKLLKIPISLLRKINIRVIIYLDDMLILSHTIRDAHMSRDTVIYLLQNLGIKKHKDK